MYALIHGDNCKKEEHLGDGYHHSKENDKPYVVDGLAYCGRCHAPLESKDPGSYAMFSGFPNKLERR